MKDPKTWPFILLRVQSPYEASCCTPYPQLNVFLHTVNTTAAVNNPYAFDMVSVQAVVLFK